MRETDRLSDVKCRKATKPGMLLDGDGLYLQVAKGGSKSWIFRYRNKATSRFGKPLIREMGLGAYPLWSLKEARERRDAQRKLLTDKIDPIEHKKAEEAEKKIERAKTTSFRDCAQEYVAAHKHGWKNAKHVSQWTSSLEAWAFPIIGDLPVAKIDTALVMKILKQRIGPDVDAPILWNARTETASRVRGRIDAILGWATAQGLRRGDNPAGWGILKHLLPKKSTVAPTEHHAALPYVELSGFMAELRAIDTIAGRALEWTILCAVRSGDTIGARWSEIDRDAKTWTIPGRRLKAKKGTQRPDHVVPLSDRALAILDAMPKGDASARIFDIGTNSMLLALSDMRPGLTVHGFRTTFKDWCGDMTRYPNEMSELALAHTVSDRVEAAYRRSDMREKRRRMMADWCDFCQSPPRAKGDNVIALRS